MLQGVPVMAATIQEWPLPGFNTYTGIFIQLSFKKKGRIAWLKLSILTRDQVFPCWDLEMEAGTDWCDWEQMVAPLHIQHQHWLCPSHLH